MKRENIPIITSGYHKEVQLNKFILIQESLQNAHNVKFVS